MGVNEEREEQESQELVALHMLGGSYVCKTVSIDITKCQL